MTLISMSVRRIFHRVTAVMALLTTSFAVVPAAAAAEDETRLKLEAPRSFMMFTADEGADAVSDTFGPWVKPRSGTARNVKLRIDTRGLRDVATPHRKTRKCVEQTGRNRGVFVCDYGSAMRYGHDLPAIELHGRKGMRPGESGVVRLTATADNAEAVHGSTRMRVGGPQVEQSRKIRLDPVEKGGKAAFSPVFANRTGLRSAPGFVLDIEGMSPGADLLKEYRNCYYSRKDGSRAWCEFPGRIEPHTAYRTASPLHATKPDNTVVHGVSYTVDTRPVDEHPDTEERASFVRGEGPELTLKRVPEGSVPTPRKTEGWGTEVILPSTDQVDYEAIARPIRGKVGETVRVSVGVRMLGPNKQPGIGQTRAFEITAPEGTTITGMPWVVDGDQMDWRCSPKRGKEGSTYVCGIGRGGIPTLEPGDKATVDVDFRIDGTGPHGGGEVRATGRYDRTPKNDVAAITVATEGRTAGNRIATWWVPVTVSAAVVLGGLVLALRWRRRRDAA